MDFAAARIMIWIISAIGFLAMVAAILLAVLAYLDGQLGAGLMVAGGVFGAGLVVQAIAQIAKAQVVTAENSAIIVRMLGRIATGDVPGKADKPE